MDESFTIINSLLGKPRCSSKQVENLSKKTNLSSEVVSVSINKDCSNTEAKLSLPTRKQRLKEYLTTSYMYDENVIPSHQLYDVPTVHLINLVPKINDYKQPVKVKSRWTHTSQMELTEENSVSPQTMNLSSVNNLCKSSEIINQVFTMAVTPVNGVNKPSNLNNGGKSIQINNHNILIGKNGHVVVEQSDSLEPVKRKRGRPKKIVVNNDNETPIISAEVEKDSVLSNTLIDLKPEYSRTSTIVTRGRVGQKKDLIISNITSLKKKERKKRIVTNKKECLIKKKNVALKNEIDLKCSANSDQMKLNENLYNVNGTDIILSNVCVTLERYDSPECINNPRIIVESSSKEEKELFIDFNKVNWNTVPKRIRSKSVEVPSKIQHRRNSLSDNFIYSPVSSSTIFNEDYKLMRTWKSHSYLESGPNIHLGSYQRNEVDKTYKLKVRRSRSFPNCMLLDTVTWRFLVYQQTHPDPDEGYFFSSGSETDLLNEVLISKYDRRYRSKSEPTEQYESIKQKNKYLYRSVDNLNMLGYTNNLLSSSFQITSDLCDLKNTESDSEECEGKIRRSKRLNTKVKHSDMLEEEYMMEHDESELDSLLLAEQIRKENYKQLSEARKNDPELENKLKKLNFTLITNNMFRPHRKDMSKYTSAEALELRRLKHRRIINADTYKCYCTYSRKDFIEKKPGCGPECINRLLNIECGSGCSLMSFCTNKQFQKKQFKRTEIVRTPNKGYGVFALENIPSGTFVDEYMGEVIDQHEMIKRMKKRLYKDNNYMVQLKHDEIIDATRKGNITRFINHSCEPNCVAEKWNVLGESRMGFFSKVLINKGEEITFDYSFEIFGDAAQQKCYCNTPKCRGFISKKSRTGDQSSSDESDDNLDNILSIKSDERETKKKKITVKKISNKDRKRLRELDQQLRDISKLQNKNRSDLESSTLNLNKLMVHITDTMSRSHILKFIRDNDLNCKRLFMNFNGLSIIHSWMTSNNNNSLKLEIIKTLTSLHISNRNTITKSKVLDIVAEWAKIPSNIKEMIENLEYPESRIEEHSQEVDKLLPEKNNVSPLIQAARALWKKWIILKMVFKIPKLDRPKEDSITNDISKPPIALPQSKRRFDQFYFEKPAVPTHSFSINHQKIKNKLNNVKYIHSQDTTEHIKNTSMETFSKMINHQNQINNRDKNKAVLEWNKKHWAYTNFKTNEVNCSVIIKGSNKLSLKTKYGSVSSLKSKDIHQDIPTIESNALSKKIKWNSPTIEFTPKVYEVPTNVPSKSVSTNKICTTKPTEYYPIEEIITSNQSWNLRPPTFVELKHQSTLESILKMPPPCLPSKYMTNSCNENEVEEYLISQETLSIMNSENVLYDASHPSIHEQLAFMPLQSTVKNAYEIVISDTNSNENSYENNYDYITTPIQTIVNNPNEIIINASYNDSTKTKSYVTNMESSKPIQKTIKSYNEILVNPSDTDTIKADLDKNNIIITKVVQPIKKDIQKKLLKQCEENIKKLQFNNFFNVFKSGKNNYLDRSPLKISSSFIKVKSIVPDSRRKNESASSNLFKCLKIASNFYQEQPSKIIKISNLISACIEQSKHDSFRIKEEDKTEKMADATSIAFKFYNDQLSTTSQSIDINKLLKNQSVRLKTENKLACKILNGLMKKCSTMPGKFFIKLPLYTKINTLDPINEIELHHKLTPTVTNTLCAKLKKEGKDTINVFKQNFVMEYDESKLSKLVIEPELILKDENSALPMSVETTTKVRKSLKRKMPLPPMHSIKSKKIVDLSIQNNIRTSRNKCTVVNQTNGVAGFKKPNKSNYFYIDSTADIQDYNESNQITSDIVLLKANATIHKPSTSKQVSQNIALIKNNEIRQKPRIPHQRMPVISLLESNSNVLSSQESLPNTVAKINKIRSSPSTPKKQSVSSIDVFEIDETNLPSTSNQTSPNIDLVKTNEIRQKPLMKCLPFNKVDNIPGSELEQNATNLATCFGMNYTADDFPSTQTNSDLIDPIVENFKTSISAKKTRTNLTDDPIVRDYLQRTQLKSLKLKRKCKLPESMVSLPEEVLSLLPDTQREIKYVIDFYHTMATVIVKILDSYVKKSCKQGRIKNDDDFKYLAKKLNSNILYKELQAKKVEDLRISDSVKQKVEQYIKKYMLKYGKLYRRKSTDQ